MNWRVGMQWFKSFAGTLIKLPYSGYMKYIVDDRVSYLQYIHFSSSTAIQSCVLLDFGL